MLGAEAVAGEFIDDRHGWQRLSETWADPDLGDPDLGMELATRPHGLHHHAGAPAGALISTCAMTSSPYLAKAVLLALHVEGERRDDRRG